MQKKIIIAIAAVSRIVGLEPVVQVLYRKNAVAVVAKPPSVPVHASPYVGGTIKKIEEKPLLQRARDALGSRINLVHRLDRGASGCVLCVCIDRCREPQTLTSELHEALRVGRKRYVALVRGTGVFKGQSLGANHTWFDVERPIKDSRGKINDARTSFRFLGYANHLNSDRCSLVLAEPQRSGRWHQIKRHLNGLSHPIIGDSSHGNSQTNRFWREHRGLPAERILLHFTRIQIPPTSACPEGIDVSCPLPSDFSEILASDTLTEITTSPIARQLFQEETSLYLPLSKALQVY
mmetsp:Transcript_19926/g.30341  ORF Transcript_19926/g.30341 Transcript_19926/m.30341 type:complete len:293 (+) Transcript_19926:2-880(+)